MGASRIDTVAAPVAEPVKVAPSREDKTVDFTPDSHVEAGVQYIDEYSPERAMAMMSQHIAMAEDVRRNGGGRWEMPPTHRHIVPNGLNKTHRVTRLGTMSDPRRRDAILRQRFTLEQMGWSLAPSGTRNSLYLTDGDQGVYMLIAEVAGLIHDGFERETRRKLRERRFSRTLTSLPEDLQSSGLSFDRVDVTQGRTSISDFKRMK
jgi:hypothetical protein